jgi:hypothetical protein
MKNAPSSEESTSMLEVLPPSEVIPPRTTSLPLTAQHAWPRQPVTRAGMPPHRSVARSSLHTSSNTTPAPEYPPHTTSPGRVLRNSFAPTRAALHTRIRRHAPTSPRCDEGPHLGEPDGAVDGPVGSRAGDWAAVRHGARIVVRSRRQRKR